MFEAIERADRRISGMLSAREPPHPREAPRRPGHHPAMWDFISQTLAYSLERKRLKELRRLERERRKAERRRQREQPNPVAGVVMLTIAGVLTYLAATGQPFWFLFIALGLALGGANQFRRRLPNTAGEKTATSEDDRQRTAGSASAQRGADGKPGAAEDEARRVDEIAKQLLKELKEGPAILREIVASPEDTVEGLRRGYHALAGREKKLRDLVPPEDEARLGAERAALVSKRDRTHDDVARSRYDEAIRALDLQRAERVAVVHAAERLEAERTRLRYTLEGLLAQVVRARSMHGIEGAANDAALRQSLERLSDEVGAVTEALEAVHRADLVSPVSPVHEGGAPDSRGPRSKVR